MSKDNGVIRIGRKGLKKFAFGEDGKPFEVDIVSAFQEWISIDDAFREEEDTEGIRSISLERMPAYHQEAVALVERLSTAGETREPVVVTPAEALDFLARLREQYDELAVFFRPKLREKRDSPDTSEAELRFSVEETESN